MRASRSARALGSALGLRLGHIEMGKRRRRHGGMAAERVCQELISAADAAGWQLAVCSTSNEVRLACKRHSGAACDLAKC